MGRRDYRHHETKKTKKSAKKVAVTGILPPTATVEVIKAKGKKEPEKEA